MVDYTKDPSTNRGIGIYLAAGGVVLILLYALFAGGNTSAPEGIQAAPVAEESPAIITD